MVLVLLVLKGISSKCPFTVFMKLIFGLRMSGASVRLGSVRIWWLCASSQDFPPKPSSLNFCPAGWWLLELCPPFGLGQQAAEKSCGTLSTPVVAQPSRGEWDGASSCPEHLPAAAHGAMRREGKGYTSLHSPQIWYLELSWYIHVLSGWRTTINILQSYSCCFQWDNCVATQWTT